MQAVFFVQQQQGIRQAGDLHGVGRRRLPGIARLRAIFAQLLPQPEMAFGHRSHESDALAPRLLQSGKDVGPHAARNLGQVFLEFSTSIDSTGAWPRAP